MTHDNKRNFKLVVGVYVDKLITLGESGTYKRTPVKVLSNK